MIYAHVKDILNKKTDIFLEDIFWTDCSELQILLRD